MVIAIPHRHLALQLALVARIADTYPSQGSAYRARWSDDFVVLLAFERVPF